MPIPVDKLGMEKVGLPLPPEQPIRWVGTVLLSPLQGRGEPILIKGHTARGAGGQVF